MKISYSKEEIKTLIENDLKKMNATNVSIELVAKRSSDSFVDVTFDVGLQEACKPVELVINRGTQSVFDDLVEQGFPQLGDTVEGYPYFDCGLSFYSVIRTVHNPMCVELAHPMD